MNAHARVNADASLSRLIRVEALSADDHRVLAIVAAHPGKPLARLAELSRQELGRVSQCLTRRVLKLCRDSLAECRPDPDNRAVSLYHLTEKGRATLSAAY